MGKSLGEVEIKILERTFRGTGYEDVKWIEMAQDRTKWQISLGCQ
jgi:hypothetical protein